MNKGLIRGGESTSHDSGNDILYTIKETKQQVLIEGDEYHLCKAALMNNEIHEYKNNTNKQILEDIYTRSSCMVKEGEANVGDFIICKLAVRDKKKRNLTGTIAEIISIMQKEHGCRVVDGAEYEKMKKGGSLSKTPAPKKQRIYGSKRNPKGTSATGDSAKSIQFSESTLDTIKNKVDEHNKKHPDKKVTIEIAKAVVRRGMGAYSSTHRPTIKGGKPNSRVAWGLARLNAFLYKAVKGESKSGKYSQDNDLLDELGIKHRQFEDGGEVGFKPPYPINEAGGYEYTGKAKETAKKVDLLSLPRNVDGTHCGNCFFQEQGICVHKGIMLPVTERMCCAVWDNSNSDRSYEKNIEKDKGEIPEKIKSFPKNDNGGYTYSGKALEIAKKYDLITLPKKIEGTNCSNCAWFSPYKDGGFCFKSSIWLPVTARMSCASWNNLSVKRDWSLFKKGGSMKNNSEDIDTSKWEMPSKSIYRYAEKIRTEHPDIWDKGGNVFGNEAYENLERVIKRGHWLPSEEWMYKKWQSFMARHEGDFRIAGVIANLKWLNWVGKGEAYSKSLIESEIKDKKVEKKANGGEVSTEVENVKRGLRMLVGSNLFRDREYQDDFYYNGKKYYIDFVIGTDNAITEDVMMVVHRDLGGGDNDEIVLAMPFDMNKFDFNYDDFYEVFPKVEYKKLAEGGSVVGKFGDFKYPEMYVPSSLYIPQTIKNQISKKDLPKKVASFPYDFNLLDAVDIFKNIYGDESGLRDNQSAIYLLGDTIAATDAHKMCFVGLNKKQYGAYFIPKKKDYKFLMDNKEPIEKIFKADENNLWVKNVDKESHIFYSILPRTLDFAGYQYQSKIDIQSLYRYLYFVTENNLVSEYTKQVSISYFYEDKQNIISFNADYLIDICELYASFGLKEFYVYCSTPNKAVIFSKNALDKESFITSQLKDNLFSILMPVLNQDVPLGVSDIDYKINVGIYFDLFKNKVMDEKGNPTDLTSKVSILSENEFQFIRSSFNKNYQFVKKSGSLKDLDTFLDNYAEQNGLNGTYYYDMSPKQIKLAFALSWIRPFL